MIFIDSLIGTGNLSPHGVCLLWEPALIWLHVASDAVIALSYFSIPIALGYLVARRTDLAFGWMVALFGVFILACGTTHLFGIWTIWRPDYGLEGVIKAATALVSMVTAVALWPLVPKLLALPSEKQLMAVLDDLSREIDERTRAVDSLRESEHRYGLLVRGVTDYAISMLDPSGLINNWNAGAQRIEGYDAEEVVGRHFSLFFTAEDRARGAPQTALEIAARDGKYETEAVRVRKDGSQFWANIVIDALRDDAGRLIGFANITRDITERVRAARTIDETRAALAQAQKMEAVGQLTGGVAHDFNNLLTAVIGSLDLLLEGFVPVDPAIRPFLVTAMTASRRGAALTHSLLAFSRQQALAPEVADINKLVGGMSEILRRSLGETIHMETVLAGGLWRARIDPNQLESAILNLAINARDAMPDGGKLTIETGNAHLDDAYAAMHAEVATGQYVLIAVTDTGTGMTAETVARVFEPFFTTKAEGRGSGLGLSQVYGFVKQSGGHTKVYSEIGLGTTVKIYLPRHVGEVAAEEPAAPVNRELGSGETILVVEDDVEVAQFTVRALRLLGYQPLQADRPGVALEIIQRRDDIRLLLTDVVLPGMNGRALAEEAARLRPRLKVLFMTGYARNAIVHHGVLDADVELIPKPFTVSALMSKLRQVLNG
jgi:PAS domain S-box-containing protein